MYRCWKYHMFNKQRTRLFITIDRVSRSSKPRAWLMVIVKSWIEFIDCLTELANQWSWSVGGKHLLNYWLGRSGSVLWRGTILKKFDLLVIREEGESRFKEEESQPFDTKNYFPVFPLFYKIKKVTIYYHNFQYCNLTI